MRKPARKTALRAALKQGSSLGPLIVDGLGAIQGADRKCLDEAVRSDFSDSLNLDAALESQHQEEHRWDYLLGYAPTGNVIAVEPHSGRDDEVSVVIAKCIAARRQLALHLRDGARIERWLWVSSGGVRFANTEKTRRLLDQHGIQFVGTRIFRKHLPK